ncbi:MAG: hypothetical protein E7423_10260 [Ruminococcaceae bacterium]|nr:hypothetical protein [Oscillospiraceae bacterium]
MDKEQLMRALGEIDDAYIMEAAPQAVRKRPRLLWPAAAACAALALALAGFLYHPAPAPVTQAPETTQSALLASLKNGGVQETAAREASVPVEGRIAVYEQIGSGGRLADLTGEPFAETETGVWRRVTGMEALKYLLLEEENGPTLWEFRSFAVLDGALMQLEAAEATETELKELRSQYAARFPDADLSPYTYGDVLRIIYGVESAEDLKSVTASPSVANNTDEGKAIQREVGTRVYDDPETLQLFYDAVSPVVCWGSCGWSAVYRDRTEYRYSFSTDSDDKLTSGEETWGTRYLTVETDTGLTNERWKYSSLYGMFFEFGGVGTESLTPEQVNDLNALFGIE